MRLISLTPALLDRDAAKVLAERCLPVPPPNSRHRIMIEIAPTLIMMALTAGTKLGADEILVLEASRLRSFESPVSFIRGTFTDAGYDNLA